MTKQPERIKVKRTCDITVGDILHGKLEDIIPLFQDLKDEGEWEGIEEHSDMYSPCPSYRLYRYSLETDYEYEIRMKEFEKEERKKLKEKEKRRIQYEKLKKEFGDT